MGCHGIMTELMYLLMGYLDMIKRFIYILFLVCSFNCYGQYNFFSSHPAIERFHLFTDTLQYIAEEINYDIYFLDKPHSWAGTKIYILGGGSRSIIYQYTTNNYKVRGASYSDYFDTQNQDIYPTGIEFKSDGKKMYVIGTENDRIYQYSLSSDWSVETASYDSKYLDFSMSESAPTAIFFKPDGSGLFILGQEKDLVQYYPLLVNWDIDTDEGLAETFYVGDKDPNPKDLFFSPDGKKMYIAGSNTDTIYRYTLSDAWTLPASWNEATATHDKVFDIGSSFGPLNGMFIKQDLNKLYITGGGNVYTYWLDELPGEDLE
jgi:DNA-binding beta-propeller fold protein YncE